MSIETVAPLSLWRVDFAGIYTRHLGRHSQFGINANHLLALFMLWFGIYAFLTQFATYLGLPYAWALPIVMASAYLCVVSVKSPLHVIVATALFLVALVGGVLLLPPLPVWGFPLFLILIPLGYKFQSWGHKVWTVAADMSEFNRRYPPGRDLNVVLLFYEVPICLNYLVFRRNDWRR